MKTQRRHMSCLPQYDVRTRRAELAAFTGLGLGAIVLIAVTVADTLQFADKSDELAQALSWDSASLAQAPANSNRWATNFTVVPPSRPGTERDSGHQPAKPP